MIFFIFCSFESSFIVSEQIPLLIFGVVLDTPCDVLGVVLDVVPVVFVVVLDVAPYFYRCTWCRRTSNGGASCFVVVLDVTPVVFVVVLAVVLEVILTELCVLLAP